MGIITPERFGGEGGGGIVEAVIEPTEEGEAPGYQLVASSLLWRAGDVLNAIDAGKLRLRIDRTYPLADAASAHRDLESRAELRVVGERREPSTCVGGQLGGVRIEEVRVGPLPRPTDATARRRSFATQDILLPSRCRSNGSRAGSCASRC